MIRTSLFFLSTALVLVLTTLAESQSVRGGRGRRAPLSFRLILLPEVQHELRITSNQVELFQALQADILSQSRSRDAGTREARNAVVAKLWNVLLEKDQALRFSEVKLQFEGLFAIDRDDRAGLVKDLKLTDRQLRAIRELRQQGNPVDIVSALDDLLEDKQLRAWEGKLGKAFDFTDDTLAYRDEYLPLFQRRRRFESGRR